MLIDGSAINPENDVLNDIMGWNQDLQSRVAELEDLLERKNLALFTLGTKRIEQCMPYPGEPSFRLKGEQRVTVRAYALDEAAAETPLPRTKSNAEKLRRLRMFVNFFKESKYMPHDKNGHVLKVGDKVVIHASVTSITEGQEYCNLGVSTDEVMFPSNEKTSITLNAKQVERVPAKPPEPAAAPPAAAT